MSDGIGSIEKPRCDPETKRVSVRITPPDGEKFLKMEPMSPAQLRGRAFQVLEDALVSEDWKERLGAARIVLSKVDDGEEIEEGLDVLEAATRRHDERQRKLEMPEEEE